MLLQALQGAGELLLRPAPLLADSFRQRQVLGETAHRPWPVPDGPWVMGQTWCDLLFAHWRVPAEELERVVPPQLPLDLHEGSAWLGVTPFFVRGLRLRGTAPLPHLSSFPEINVRTYVNVDGKPGIYFLSLDAARRAAVSAARRSYRLPYFHARIAASATEEGVVSYDSVRTSVDGPPACFQARFGPEGDLLPQRDGSLERWLTERYCLYTLDSTQRIHRGEIHHPPWPLHRAWAEIQTNTMAMPFGLLLEGDPLLHFSARQDVALWPIRPLDAQPAAGRSPFRLSLSR
jgi:uncharacterized protein YqjF (DUF2071 family)